jgi:AbrB family looped-hinge helix DNA binding protein
MRFTLIVDRAGRIKLPPPVRDVLQINPGDTLKVESSEDHITLRPIRSKGRIYKKRGIWVFHSNSGVTLSAETVNRTVKRVRAERERHILGKYKK